MSLAVIEPDVREVSPADIEAVVSGDVMQQISTAKRYPRSVTKFMQAMTELVTINKEVAAQCLYALPRGGKTIEGPSIRFAEIAIAMWGNCRTGARIVGTTDRFVIAEGFFWDLQSNSAIAVQAQRRITDKKGEVFNDDMIGVTGNAAASIALRNAALRGVPKAFWWELYLKAKACTIGDLKTLAERRKNAVEAFKPFGVTETQICQTLGLAGVRDIGIEHLATLAGFLTAIQQEDRDPEEIFVAATTNAKPVPPAPPPEGGTGAPQNAAPKSEGAGASKPSPSQAGEAKGGAGGLAASSDDEPTPLEVSVAGMISEASSVAELQSIPDFFSEDMAKAPDAVKARVKKQIADAVAARKGGTQ